MTVLVSKWPAISRVFHRNRYIVIVIIKIIWNLWDSFLKTHHHGDHWEEVPIALDSDEHEGYAVCEEYHGWSEANKTQSLKMEVKDSSWDMLMLTSALLFKFK